MDKVSFYNKGKQINTLFANNKEKTDRFLAIAYQASSNENLAKCSQDSIVNAVIQCAQLDLSLDNQIGQAYLVPFYINDVYEARLQIGFRGWQVLLKRFGYDVKCYPIYTVDSFNYSIHGWEEDIHFVPNFVERDDGNSEWVFDNLFGVLTFIKDAHGEITANFITKKLVEKLRLKSSNQKATKKTYEKDLKKLAQGKPIGIWEEWYSEMAQAKAIKQAAKKMPLAETLVKIIKDDDLIEIGEQPEQKEEPKENLNSLLLAQQVPHNPKTGEVEPIDIRKAFRVLLIQNKVERNKAFELEKQLSDEDIQAYLDDPASVETLLIFKD